MKTRSGFVSNSSSSSFIIAWKGDDKALERKLHKVFQTPKKGPLRSFAENVIALLLGGDVWKTEKAYRKYHCYDDDEELPHADLFKKFGKIRTIRVSNESGESLDEYLYSDGDAFEVKTPTLVIRFEGH